MKNLKKLFFLILLLISQNQIAEAKNIKTYFSDDNYAKIRTFETDRFDIKIPFGFFSSSYAHAKLKDFVSIDTKKESISLIVSVN